MKTLAAITAALALAGCAASPTPPPPAPLRIFAAGSLTGALTAMAKAYTAQTGQPVVTEFGPAGLMRERIEAGDLPDLFASANMAHPQKLADAGQATPPMVFLRNRLCASALPGSGLTTANVFDRLMDPKVGLGTSTPGADPGGDYAYALFAKAERSRPGARALLEGKAQQLVGGRNNPPVPAGQGAMAYWFSVGRVHLTLGYCSGRQTTPDPAWLKVELPPELAIRVDYGLSVLTKTGRKDDAAWRFANFLMGTQAQAIAAQYGFTPVAAVSPPN